MINLLIVCIIIQCLSHSADQDSVSEFTNPSTKKALAEHLGASPAARVGPSFTCFKGEREFTKEIRDTSCVLKAQLPNSAEKW